MPLIVSRGCLRHYMVLLFTSPTRCTSRQQTFPQCRHLANWTKHKRRRLCFCPMPYITWKHDITQKKPEVNIVSHFHQRRTESQPQITYAEIFVKFGRVIFEIRERTDRQTNRLINRQTYRHTDHNTPYPYRDEVKISWVLVPDAIFQDLKTPD